MLKLDDLTFEIASATLDAFIDEERGGICWGLSIRTVPREVEDAGAWTPFAESEVLLVTKPHALRAWTDLAGTRLSWTDDAYDEEHETYRATLHVYDQYPIYASELTLVADGGGLRLSWRARSDVQWKEERYWEELPLVIDAPVTFAGFLCGRADEATARAEVGAMIDATALRFVQDDGVSRLVPV